MLQTALKIFETRTVVKETGFTGSGSQDFYVVSGSRMLITLLVTSIDVGATVNLYIDNNFDTDESDDTVLNLSANSVTRVKRVLTDFHNQFIFRYTVTGGSATFKVGVSLFDNAMTTHIENAVIDVDLSHTVDSQGNFDSVRIGNGTNTLNINPDGSINVTGTIGLPSGAATEAKQDVGNASLASILTSVDGLESAQATANSSLSSIVSNTDQIEPKLDTLISNTDGIEGSLTQIANNTDQIESKLDDVVSAISSQEPVKISGTENGQAGGVERVFVNNLRLQILAAKDKQQHITYADFGTKDQRITSVTYTAASIGSGAGFTAVKTITYTLVGTKYRRDDINWSLV